MPMADPRARLALALGVLALVALAVLALGRLWSRSEPHCDTTLQALIDAAPPGAVVRAPPCIFRETVVIAKPLTLDGQGRAEIRGSDVWADGWEERDGYWIHPGVPEFNHAGNCRAGTRRCRWPEQVFLDGQPLTQVAEHPRRGEFAVDERRNLVLADDPRGRQVEVSTRERWIVIRADEITIQGFRMRHAANQPQRGAISNDGYARWTLRGNVLSDAHGAVVSLQGGYDARVLDNEISRGGQEGIHGTGEGSTQHDYLIQGNRIHDNNTEDFATDWEAGGLKLTLLHGLTIAGNEVYANQGVGIWCDISCEQVTISDNRVHHNTHNGIAYEISRDAAILQNTVWENGWSYREWAWGAGILISSSADAIVRHNALAWNAQGISIVSQDRRPLPHANILVEANDILMDRAGGTALGWFQDWGGGLYDRGANNRGVDNRYWFESEQQLGRGFAWADARLDLERFNATPGGQRGRLLLGIEKELVLLRSGIDRQPLARPAANTSS